MTLNRPITLKKMKETGTVSVSLRDIALITLTLIGWAANYATLSSRVTADEQTLAQLQSRYEREVVPRSEHIEMNKRLEERLAQIDNELQNINRQMVSQNSRR